VGGGRVRRRKGDGRINGRREGREKGMEGRR
jgi:hypothetical protein